jgi:hypothetical protein
MQTPKAVVALPTIFLGWHLKEEVQAKKKESDVSGPGGKKRR